MEMSRSNTGCALHVISCASFPPILCLPTKQSNRDRSTSNRRACFNVYYPLSDSESLGQCLFVRALTDFNYFVFSHRSTVNHGWPSFAADSHSATNNTIVEYQYFANLTVNNTIASFTVYGCHARSWLKLASETTKLTKVSYIIS